MVELLYCNRCGCVVPDLKMALDAHINTHVTPFSEEQKKGRWMFEKIP